MNAKTECVVCGFDGNAPDDWWHVPLSRNGVYQSGEGPDTRICDLCWFTNSGLRGDVGESIRATNYGFNRSLEVLREMRAEEWKR